MRSEIYRTEKIRKSKQQQNNRRKLEMVNKNNNERVSSKTTLNINKVITK